MLYFRFHHADAIRKGETPFKCVRYVDTVPKESHTAASLIESGIPVNLDKFKWNAKAIRELSDITCKLAENKANNPPGKSVLKFIKENILTPSH